MPNTADTITPLGVLHACGYDLRIRYYEDSNSSRHFEITALGMCMADTPLGEVVHTSRRLLCPALRPDASRIGFGLDSPSGGFLMRFLVEISAALDGGAVLNSQWDFEHHPDSPLTRKVETAGAPA